MIQDIVVVLLFLAALIYLGRLLFQQFQAKTACASGCSKCSVVDFKKIETELKSKGL